MPKRARLAVWGAAIVLIVWHWYLLALVLVLSHFLAWLFLKKSQEIEAGCCAPVSGQLKDSTFQNITLRAFWWSWQLAMPVTAEVMASGDELKVKTEDGDELIIQFCPRFRFFTCLNRGDRVARGTNFGFMPFGGDVLLYLPKNYEILINSNSIIKKARTIIARSDNGK